MTRDVNIKLGKPVVISQADENIKTWGPWQFPSAEINDKGQIHVSFHINSDSSTAYGKPKAHFISNDEGNSWDQVDDFEGFGLKLDNGDCLLPFTPKSVKLENISLPKPVAESYSYNVKIKYYEAIKVDANLNGWYLLRKKAGEKYFKKERIQVNFPGNLLYAREGVLSGNFFWRMKLMPNGNICALTYQRRLKEKKADFWAPQFLVSKDYGHSFKLISEIPYSPIKKFDDKCEKRDGFSEPDITFLPDCILCLLRTTDGSGIGPMYFSRSYDNMKTWSKPSFFSPIGVWPELLTLDNGITLASYGRPGLLIRGTSSKEGIFKDTPMDIIKPHISNLQKDTCSYSSMIPLKENKALLVYSDFNYPDDKGVKRKSILARTIKAEKVL